MTTDQKGAIAEAAIAHAALELGIEVYTPMYDQGRRYDMIFGVADQLLRVQCKWAPRHGDVIEVRCQSCRRTRNGMTWRSYTEEEIDAIAAYCVDTDRCYLLPASIVAGRRQFHLRLAPARNNQRLGLNWADLYEFGSISWEDLDQLGAIAQLEERSAGSRKVVGSSPTSSTSDDPDGRVRRIGSEELREGWARWLYCVAAGEELLVTRRGRPVARLLPALEAPAADPLIAA